MITYRLATYKDNRQLIELAASGGMEGTTSLRIDRNPDFFALLNMRGDSTVFVALDGSDIVGSLSASIQQVFIDGKIYKVLYIGDFKVKETYRGKGIGIHLCDDLANYALSIDGDLVFLTVAKGNTKPLPFFKGRSNIPDFKNIGTFIVHQFIGSNKKKVHQHYSVESATINEEAIDFLNSHYRNYQLGSVITKEKLAGTDLYLLRHNKDIVAVMCLADMMPVKQNIIVSMPWRMKLLLKLINVFHRVPGISRMPKLNKPVQMIYIKYLGVNNNEKEPVELLIRHAANIAYEKKYSFVSLGLHEKDPLNDCLGGLRKLSFYSTGMFLSMKNDTALFEAVKQGIPFEDYSLV